MRTAQQGGRTVEDCQGHVLYQQYLYQQDMLALAAMLQLPVACALGRSFEISSGAGAAAPAVDVECAAAAVATIQEEARVA